MLNYKKMILTAAALAMGISAYQPAHASTEQDCRNLGIGCAVGATGSLLICYAAAIQGGADYPNDILCSNLAKTAGGDCAFYGFHCKQTSSNQPSIHTLSFSGRSEGAVDETRTCGGSHRVTGITILRQNNLIRRVRFKCSSGALLTTGPALGTASSASCSSGRLLQGAHVIVTSGGTHVTGFSGACDSVKDTTTQDTNFSVGSMPAGGSSQSRICPEGSYVVGYRAIHDGSAGYLRGIGLLCRGMPR